MSMALLDALQERLHHLAVAGVGVIAEDFRVKRLVEQFEPLTSPPIFAKIYEQIKPLIDPACPDKVEALITALSLVDAVVCTGASWKAVGELAPIDQSVSGQLTLCKYSEIAPLHQALTGTGSGRYEVIKKAQEEKNPALLDYRLKEDLLGALSDSYGEIGDLVANILKAGGSDTILLLKRGFDPGGKKDMARRLEIISAVGGKLENDFYLSLLANASEMVKEAAILALGSDNGNVGILVGLIQAEKAKLKKTALTALSQINTQEATAFWLSQVEKNIKLVAPYLASQTSDELADAIGDKLGRVVDTVLSKGDGTISTSLYEQMDNLLIASSNKYSHQLAASYQMLADASELIDNLILPNKNKVQLSNVFWSYSANTGGVKGTITDYLILGLHHTKDPRFIQGAKSFYTAYHGEFFRAYFVAVLLEDPASSYAVLAHDLPLAGADMIQKSLSTIRYDQPTALYYLRYAASPYSIDLGRTLDKRWMVYLISLAEAELNEKSKPGRRFYADYEELIYAWLDESDEAMCQLVGDYFLKSAKLGLSGQGLVVLDKLGLRENMVDFLITYGVKSKNLQFYHFTYLLNDLTLTLPMRKTVLIQILKRKDALYNGWSEKAVADYLGQF